MEREVTICSTAGRADGKCGCYACALRKMVEAKNRAEAQLSVERAKVSELSRAVENLRYKQREYYRTRSEAALAQMELAGKWVDELLRRHRERTPF